MKKSIYATLAVFIAILIIMAVVAVRTPIHEVKYEDGKILAK
jgi:hypothetical protein